MNVRFVSMSLAAIAVAVATLGPVAAEERSPEPARAVVRLSPAGLEAREGKLRCLAFNAKGGFPSDRRRAFAATEARVVARQATCVFDTLPPGTWAFAFIHDQNEDGELNTNFLGIPTEGYGFSRDATGTFGPPDFEDAAMLLVEGAFTLSPRMRY